MNWVENFPPCPRLIYYYQTFVNYMDDNKKLRDMIETGKGNLQWERDIPASALANLQQLAQKDFRSIYS